MKTTTINAAGDWLEAGAAASYLRARAAGLPAGVTDAGRTNAEQWDVWRDYLAGRLKATAAYPGTSKHEKGNALDLPEPARAWMRAHGAEYGWVKDRVANEPWHFEYDATKDKHKNTSKPKPKKENPDMHIIRRGLKLAPRSSRKYALVTGDRAVPLTVDAYAQYKKAGHDAVPLPESDYDRITKALVTEK